MSETVRNYSRGTLQRRSTRSRSRVGRTLTKNFVIFLVVLSLPVGGYCTWISRDSRTIDEFIPAGRPLELVLWEPLTQRSAIARTALWESLPEDSPILAARATLQSEFGLPQWVLRNLMGEYVYISGRGENGLEDVLIVTRVSRVGTAIERAYRFSPKVKKEDAGGLDIREWTSEGVYYALKGRILLASPSRRTLIDALTLSASERRDPQDIVALFTRGMEDIKGTVTSEDAVLEVFQSLSFAANVTKSGVAVKIHGLLNPDVEAQFGDLIGHAAATPLPAIPAGPFQVAANLNQPIRELWSALGDAFDSGLLSDAQWAAWETDRPEGFAAAMTGLLGDAGPGFSVAWRGFDLLEVAPAPIFVGAVSAGDVQSLASLAQQDSEFGLPRTRYDTASGVLRIPSVSSGPGFETAAKRDGARILVSSNSALAETFFDEASEFEASPGVANVFVGIEPRACMDLLLEAGALLAENDMLDGHTPESWQETVDGWRSRYGRIGHTTILVSADGGRVTADVNIGFAVGDSAQTAAQ